MPVRRQVFISYSNKDKEFVFKLKNDLNKHGVRTWIDVEQISPGTLWQQEIKEGIESASIVLLVISENYYSSNWVTIELALAANKTIIPLKIDRTESQKVPKIIRERQWIEFFESYSEGLRQLLAILPNDFKQKNPIKGNAEKSKGYVFISFCEDDSRFVTELRKFLKSQQFAYWDYEEGERNYHIQFSLELESVITESIAVLSVISQSWKKSKWTTREYFYADEIGKPIFLLRANETEPILAISGQPYIDFAKNPRNGFIKLEKELTKRLK
jgi:hypothetical protein